MNLKLSVAIWLDVSVVTVAVPRVRAMGPTIWITNPPISIFLYENDGSWIFARRARRSKGRPSVPTFTASGAMAEVRNLVLRLSSAVAYSLDIRLICTESSVPAFRHGVETQMKAPRAIRLMADALLLLTFPPPGRYVRQKEPADLHRKMSPTRAMLARLQWPCQLNRATRV
jgi:hypothetical protein